MIGQAGHIQQQSFLISLNQVCGYLLEIGFVSNVCTCALRGFNNKALEYKTSFKPNKCMQTMVDLSI